MSAPSKQARIIALTGRIGSGKSYSASMLQKLLELHGHSVRQVSGMHDLYVPFARRTGEVDADWQPERAAFSELIGRLYEKHGRDLGTRLLLELAVTCRESVLIVDSKRSPDGIMALKSRASGALVLGVRAERAVRIERVETRRRDYDSKYVGAGAVE